MSSPLSDHTEVFRPDNDAESITRVRRPVGEGTFVIDVPAVEGAERVVLFSSTAPWLELPDASAAVEVARARLQ